MTKRRAFKRWIAGLSALVMLLTIGLALPVGARAEKNTVRVLLTRLNLTDRLEIALDGSYTLDGMSFQRGSRLVLSCATGRIMAYYEGMALDSGKVDAVSVSIANGEMFVSTNPKLAVSTVQFDNSQNGNVIGFPKGETELVDAVNKIIDEVLEQGLYDQWLEEATAEAENLGL